MEYNHGNQCVMVERQLIKKRNPTVKEIKKNNRGKVNISTGPSFTVAGLRSHDPYLHTCTGGGGGAVRSVPSASETVGWWVRGRSLERLSLI